MSESCYMCSGEAPPVDAKLRRYCDYHRGYVDGLAGGCDDARSLVADAYAALDGYSEQTPAEAIVSLRAEVERMRIRPRCVWASNDATNLGGVEWELPTGEIYIHREHPSHRCWSVMEGQAHTKSWQRAGMLNLRDAVAKAEELVRKAWGESVASPTEVVPPKPAEATEVVTVTHIDGDGKGGSE